MRTGRARLIEWIEDIQANVGETDWMTVSAEEWADRYLGGRRVEKSEYDSHYFNGGKA